MDRKAFIGKFMYLMEKGRESGNHELVPMLHCMNIMQAADRINMTEPLANFMASFVKLVDHVDKYAVEQAKRELAGETVATDPISGAPLKRSESGILLMKGFGS